MRGIGGLWSFREGLYARDMLSGVVGTPGATLINGTPGNGRFAIPEGVALVSDETNWYTNFETNRTSADCGISGNSPRTLFVYGKYSASGSAYGVLSTGAAGGVITDFAITRYFGAWRLQMWGTSGFDYYGSFPTDRAVLIVATYDGTNAELWVDGVRVVTGIPGTLSTTGSTTVWVNGWNNYYSGTGGGKTLFAGVLPRCWSNAEIASVSRQPGSIFRRRRGFSYLGGFAAAGVQTAYPTSDVVQGLWLPSAAGSPTELYAMLDETVASDTDYIYTGDATTARVALQPLSDPVSSSGHIVHYRCRVFTGTLYVRLKQNTTTIATWSHTTADAGSLTTFSQTLSAGEANSITDYSALRIEFEAA